MGRKRRQVKSGTSSSDNSFNCAPTTKAPNKKQRTVESDSGTSPSASARESLAKFEFVPRDKNMADSESASVKGDNVDSDVFSPDRDSSTRSEVTNEDLMAKLCANGKDIAKLSGIVEQLRSELMTLQLENESLRKEVREAKVREEKLKSKIEEVKCTADLADRCSEELSIYIRRNNLRIFGIDEAFGREGREETQEECEKKVLKLFSDKLKVKVEREDIEAVHRLGKRNAQPRSPGSSTQQQRQQQQQKAPRGIIVRFVSRRVRDSVLYARRLLRGTRVLVVEDLTPRTYSLLCSVRDNTTVCQQAWTRHGKVVMKTVKGSIVTVNSLADLNEHRNVTHL